MTKPTLEDLEKAGYEEYLRDWVNGDGYVSVALCSARYIKDADERSAFLRGWGRAKREASS